MSKQFDKIGVVISKDAYGKYSVELIFDNVYDPVTDSRPLPVALREARLALDKLSVMISRGEVSFTQPQISSVKVDNHK